MAKAKKKFIKKTLSFYSITFFALFISIAVMEIIAKNYINKRIQVYEEMQNKDRFRYYNDKNIS